MNIFNLGKKNTSHRKTRKRKTKAEKRKDWAEERLMARAQTDSKAESAMIFKETGVDIPPIDEIKQEEKKKNAMLTKMAFEKIESDEDLRKRATAMKIEHILGSDPRDEHGEESQYYPLENERSPIEIVRMYRELEREFGSGNGALGLLKDPEVITQFLIALQRIFPGITGAAATGAGEGEGRTVLVEIDGQPISMSQQAYKIYREQRDQLQVARSKLKQLIGGEPPDVETEEQSDGKPGTTGGPTVEADDEGAGITPIVANKQSEAGQATTGEIKPAEVDVEEFLPFAEIIANAMEGTPQQFAEDLAVSAKGGNQDNQMLFLFLSTVTCDALIELVKPYAQTEELLPYINKLVVNKEWVEEALASIRRLAL